MLRAGYLSVILIDTHIWLWWATEPSRLSQGQIQAIQSHEADVIGVSAISCWEVAKLVQIGRIALGRSVQEFLGLALNYPGIQLLPLTPEIAVASTQLPGDFRSDPADELLVATARIHGCPLVTSDRKLRAYREVQTI